MYLEIALPTHCRVYLRGWWELVHHFYFTPHFTNTILLHPPHFTNTIPLHPPQSKVLYGITNWINFPLTKDIGKQVGIVIIF
jgi:hypothetical protein